MFAQCYRTKKLYHIRIKNVITVFVNINRFVNNLIQGGVVGKYKYNIFVMMTWYCKILSVVHIILPFSPLWVVGVCKIKLDCSLIFTICFNFFERSRCYRKYHFQSPGRGLVLLLTASSLAAKGGSKGTLGWWTSLLNTFSANYLCK